MLVAEDGNVTCKYTACLQKSATKLTWSLTAGSHLQHTDCSGVAKPTTQELRSLKTSVTAVTTNRGVKGKELCAKWQADDHVRVPTHTAYRVRERINNEGDKTYSSDFQLIGPYLQELKQLNGPRTVTDLQVDTDNKFLRCFYLNSELLSIIVG